MPMFAALGMFTAILGSQIEPQGGIVWSPGSECGREVFVQELPGPHAPDLRGRVSVRADADHGWLAEVSLCKGQRCTTKTVHGASCGDAARGAALLVELATTIDEPTEEEDVARVPAPVKPPVRVAETTTRPPATQAASRARNLHGLLRVHAGISGFAAPSIGGIVGAALGVGGPLWRVEVRGSYRFPTKVGASTLAEAGARLGRWTVGLQPCVVPAVGRFSIPVCAGLEGGRTIARGYGLPSTRRAAAPWWAATVSAGLAWQVWRGIDLVLEPQLAIPFTHERFVIEGNGRLFAAQPVSLRGFAGVTVRFP